MKSISSNWFKPSIWLLLLILLVTSIAQLHAGNNPAELIPSTPPIVDNLEIDPALLQESYPIAPDKNRLAMTYYELSRSQQIIAQPNVPSPSPFTPLGEFHATLMPAKKFAVGIDDNILAIGSNLYQSFNQGISWLTIPPLYTQVRDVALSPIDKNHMLAEIDRGLVISYDGGLTWQTVPNTYGATSTVFSPAYPQDHEIFAITGAYLGARKLYRSRDGGRTWLIYGLPSEAIHVALAPNYATSRTVMVANGGQGIIYSTNNGVNWQAVTAGLDLQYGNQVYKIIFSPSYAQDNTVFALTTYGLYRSKRNGTQWSRFLSYAISDVKFHPNYGANQRFFIIVNVKSGDEEFDALFQTNNNGASFEGLVPYVTDFDFSTTYPASKDLYVASREGFLHSPDDGATWYVNSQAKPSDHLSAHSNLVTYLVSPTFETDRTLFVVWRQFAYPSAEKFIIWKSSNWGFTWEHMSTFEREGLPEWYSGWEMALSPTYAQDKTILVLSGAVNGQTSLYKSTDEGRSWHLLNDNLPANSRYETRLLLSSNYSHDGTLFVRNKLFGEDSTVHWSQDDGQTWQLLYSLSDNGPSIIDFVIAPNWPDDPRMYILVSPETYILRSDNGGQSWSQVTAPSGGYRLHISPAFKEDDTLFVSDGNTVWRSANEGQTWKKLSYDLYTFSDMKFSPYFATDQTILLQRDGRLFWSEDRGDNIFLIDDWWAYDFMDYALLPMQGGVAPTMLKDGNFYVYFWQTDGNVGFNCQGISLENPEPQGASLGVGFGEGMGQWRVHPEDIAWLDVVANEGGEWYGELESPQLIIDTSSLTTTAVGELEVDLYFAHRRGVTLTVPVFVPCYGQNMPIVGKP